MFGRYRNLIASVLALAPALAIPLPASAQGTGRSMDLPVSIRSVGMGGASNGVFWGELDHWGNPALLGYARGMRYVHARSQLVPGLATDVFLTSDVVQLGGGGVGLVFSGQPFDRGGVHLDYGLSEGRDESGNFVGTFGSWERVESWGGGVSLVRAVENVVRLAAGHDLAWSRYADLSGGMNSKHLTMLLGPGALGDTWARDWGVHARVTPIDRLHAERGLPLRVDLAYGVSVLSYNDDALVTFLSQPSPVSRHHRRGGAVRVGAGGLADAARHASSPLRRSIIDGLAPLVSLSAAADHVASGALGSTHYKTDGWGAEITFANVLAYRRGHYQDLDGQIDDATWGWGVGLPIGGLAGIRYDEAWWPQAKDSGLRHVYRRQFSAWIDALEMRRVLVRPD